MKKLFCDICKKVLDEKKDAFYTVGEVCFQTPTDRGKKVLFRDEKGEEHGRTESWIDYSDIDLCLECWDKSEFSTVLGIDLNKNEKE